MKTKYSFILSFLVFSLALLGLLFTNIKSVTAQATTGNSHTTITGLWTYYGNEPVIDQYTDDVELNASINMDVILQTPTSTDPSIKLGANGFDCSRGGTFQIPISATGEVAGWMFAWYDSPPVEFLNNVVMGGKEWLGNTDGLSCFYGAYLGEQTNVTGQCSYPKLHGDWRDTWTTGGATGASCRTTSAYVGECTLPATVPGQVAITLERSVGNVNWGMYMGDYWPDRNAMQSSTTINCLAPAAVLEVTSAIHSPVSPTQGTLVNFYGTIKNTGNQTSSTFTPVLYIDEGSTGVWNKTIPAASPSAALAAGAEEDVIWTNAWTAIEGIHRYKICPDSSGNGCVIRNLVALPTGLSCTASPVSLSAGSSTSVTLSATGGTPSKNYRWFSDYPSDTFSVLAGPTTTFLPKRQPGTTKITVMNDYFLDVDGNGSITDNDRLLIINKLNGGTTPVPPTGVMGQNQINPLDADGNSSVNTNDVMVVLTAINNGKSTVDHTFCVPDVTVTPTVTAPTATLNISKVDGVAHTGNTATITNGKSVELTWTSTDATTCSNNFNSNTDTSGTSARHIPTAPQTIYSITCHKNGVDSIPATATVTVTDSTSGTNVRDL